MRHGMRVVLETGDGADRDRAAIAVEGLALSGPPEDIRFMLREDLVEGRYLSVNGWRAEAFWLPALTVEARPGELWLTVGPGLRKHLAPGAPLRVGLSFDRRRFVAAGRLAWPDPERPRESRRWRVPRTAVAAMAAALLLTAVAAGGWFGYRELWPRFAGPRLSEEAAMDSRCRDEARAILDRKSDAGQVVAEAKRFQGEGQIGCAFLLFKQAAGQGDVEAQTKMAKMYDPRVFDPAASPLPEPDAAIATKWYKLAAETGYGPAAQGYRDMMDWLEEKEGAGEPAIPDAKD